MKRILLLLVVGVLVLNGLGAAALNVEKESNTKPIDIENLGNSPKGYTHKVFVEVASAQFCSHCHYWNINIYNTYSSGDYDFEYVEMIVYGFGGWSDILNIKAYTWKNLYGITGYPRSIMDGNYRSIPGNQPSYLPGYLDACGNRAVPDINADMTVTWLGDATIKIDIEIENNEATQYNGYIRLPITEIISRYSTSGGAKFHFGFLDYAVPMNTVISINPGGVYTDSVTWDGNEHQDNHGDDFGDITSDNIQVVLGVFNNDNGYVDETVAARIEENEPPSAPDIDGQTSGNVGNSYEYTFTAVDPDGDDVSYYIKWGDGHITPWTTFQASGIPYSESHTWNTQGTFTIEAKAKDTYGAESDWSYFEVTIPRNRAINTPFLKFLQQHPILLQLLQRFFKL